MSYSMSVQARRNVLVLMERLRGMSDADYLESLIAYHAAPTLLGIKPATLICPRAAGRDLGRALEESAPCLVRSFGVQVAALRNRVGALLILIYHPALLRGTLAAAEVRELLAEAGYDVADVDVDALLARLGEKCLGHEFPHEIGVFLGYPAADVRCFMERRGHGCCAAGCWKAYSDPEHVRKSSARFRRAKMRAAELIVSGAKLGGVIAGLRESAA